MARVIADLFEQLRVDPWREERPFGDDFQPWHERIIRAGSDEEVVQPMNEWLAKHQPCLFGRLAAKASAITYCVLREEDLTLTDEAIMERIQDRRLAWSRDAFYGRSSAFVVIVARAQRWHGWERERSAARRKVQPEESLLTETVIAFGPDQFLRYVEFERLASGLDCGERCLLSDRIEKGLSQGIPLNSEPGRHSLEMQLGLPASDILDMVMARIGRE